MDRRVFTAILSSVVVVGLVVLAFMVFKPFLLALLWATVLSIVTQPAYRTLCRLLGGRRTIAAFVLTVLVLFIVIAPFALLLLQFIDDAGGLASDFQPAQLEARVADLLQHPWIVEGVAWCERMVGRPIDLEVEIGRLSERMLRPLLPDVGDVVGYLFRLLVGSAFVTLALFYFYRDGPRAVRALRELVPLSESDRDAILADVAGAMNAAVRGGLVTAFVQGLLGFVILALLDIERPTAWAAAMGIASLIPIGGTAIVWLPMAVLVALDGDVLRAGILAGYGALVIGVADNFLRPLLVGRHMHAHPLLLFFAILGGIALFGFAGIVLGPVVVAFLNATTRLLRREFGARRVVVAPGAPGEREEAPPPRAPAAT